MWLYTCDIFKWNRASPKGCDKLHITLPASIVWDPSYLSSFTLSVQ